MVRGAVYDPDIVRITINRTNRKNMGPTNFLDTIEHIKKEYQQLQQQLHKLRGEAEKKSQEANMLQKQNQEAAMQNQNFQLEAARQMEIVRRLQQVIQQYAIHLPQEHQQNFIRGVDTAMKVTNQDIMAMQQQQQILQAMSGQIPPQLMAMMGMDMKPQDMMSQIAAMQNAAAFSPAMQMQAQAAMAQMAQMNQLLSNPTAAAQFMAAASMPASSMAQMAAMHQHVQQKPGPVTSTPVSSNSHLPSTPMSSATIGHGGASPLQRAASSRSGSTAGTPLPKKFKMEEPQSRPISTSAKSDKSDEGGLVIDVQNEDQQQQNHYLNSNAIIPSSNGINGTVAAV